jgi:hypothetical protein
LTIFQYQVIAINLNIAGQRSWYNSRRHLEGIHRDLEAGVKEWGWSVRGGWLLVVARMVHPFVGSVPCIAGHTLKWDVHILKNLNSKTDYEVAMRG